MIRYTDTVDEVTTEQIQNFFVGWPNPPTPETHLRLLTNSDEIILAIDDHTGEVVGFITALTDHVLTAYISFLEVLPTYQHQGIGHELVKRMVTRLRRLYAIDLLCDAELQPFYASLGMQPATGMMLRRYVYQSVVDQKDG